VNFLLWVIVLVVLCAVGAWPVAIVLAVMVALFSPEPDINSPFYRAWGTALYYWRKIW